MITTSNDASLKKLNTFGIDCSCRSLITYDNPSDLKALYGQGMFADRWLHLGEGANILFETHHYDGVVLHSTYKNYESHTVGDNVILKAGNGWKWDELVQHTLECGCPGAENLSGIPASLGGAVVQNIGAYGMEICRLIESVTVFDTRTGEFRDMTCNECKFAYRTSVFKRRGCPLIVTEATLRLNDVRNWAPCLDYAALKPLCESSLSPQAIRKAVLAQRNSKLPDPAMLGNAGSFFVNPMVDEEKATELLAEHPDIPHYPSADGVKLSGGWLIEQSGLKGFTMGQAAVDSRNALVLVNLGGATGIDILMLAAHVMETVDEKFGVRLRPEVLVIG